MSALTTKSVGLINCRAVTDDLENGEIANEALVSRTGRGTCSFGVDRAPVNGVGGFSYEIALNLVTPVRNEIVKLFTGLNTFSSYLEIKALRETDNCGDDRSCAAARAAPLNADSVA